MRRILFMIIWQIVGIYGFIVGWGEAGLFGAIGYYIGYTVVFGLGLLALAAIVGQIAPRR